MSELQIDEKYLSKLANNMVSLAANLVESAEKLTDKNQPVFERYMSFCRLQMIHDILPKLFENGRKMLVHGHLINHEFFKGEKHSEGGWDRFEPEHHPFFVNKECNHDHDDKKEDLLMKVLGVAVLKDLVENLGKKTNKE